MNRQKRSSDQFKVVVFLIIAFWLLLPSHVFAQTIINDRSTTPSNSGGSLIYGSTIADKFVITGSTDWKPTAVTWDHLGGYIGFGASPSKSPVNPVVSIYLPDGQYGYIGTLLASSTSVSPGFSYNQVPTLGSYTFSGFADIALHPGTYWMTLSNPNTADYYLDVGFASHPLINTGVSGYNAETSSDYQTSLWSLDASSVAGVPEPSACGIALAGLACGGFSMWRRRRAG